MAEENKSSNADNIKLEITAQDKSKVTQIGKIEANNIYLTTQPQEVLDLQGVSSKAEPTRAFSDENPYKSLSNWVGREEKIAQLKKWLNDKDITLIGIEGIGGIGKSTLATKIYKIYGETHTFSKCYWHDVTFGADFSDLARGVLKKFGFYVPPEEAKLVEALVKCLQSGEYLLIIDNLENLLTENREWSNQFYGDLFRYWEEYGWNSTVIFTSREKPESLKFKPLPLEGFNHAEGTEFLMKLGIKGDLESFVKIVGGHPLLLRLVADLLKAEFEQDPNLSRLADLGLGNLQQLLTDSKVVGTHRHQKDVRIELVLDVSLQRLNELQRSLFLNISVFRGAIDKGMAAAVLPGSDEREIEKELRNLVKRSLLVEKLEEKRRFEFQPVVLEYAKYKAGDQRELHQRAIDYYRLNLKPEPWNSKEDIKEYLELFYHWFQLEDYDAAFDILRDVDEFLKLRGYYTIQVDLYGELIAAWDKNQLRDNWNYSVTLTSLGIAYHSLGQYQQAIELHQQSLEIAREIGDHYGEARSTSSLGNAYQSLGQYQQAIELHQQSLEIAREISDIYGEETALNNLGVAYKYLGQYQRAIDLYQQLLEIAKEIGDLNGKARALGNLGIAYKYLGKYQQAIQFQQQCLEMLREIGDRNGEARAWGNLGTVYRSLEQYQQAIECQQKWLAIAREIGDRNGEAKALGNLGNLYESLEQYEQAIEFQQQCLEISREIGDRNTEGISLGNLGIAYCYLGQYQQAIELNQQYLEIAKEIGDALGEAEAWYNLGLALEKSNLELDALGAYRNSIELYQAIGLETDVQRCNEKIDHLSQPKPPIPSRRGFWGWLRRLWCWVRGWFRR